LRVQRGEREGGEGGRGKIIPETFLSIYSETSRADDEEGGGKGEKGCRPLTPFMESAMATVNLNDKLGRKGKKGKRKRKEKIGELTACPLFKAVKLKCESSGTNKKKEGRMGNRVLQSLLAH